MIYEKLSADDEAEKIRKIMQLLSERLSNDDSEVIRYEKYASIMALEKNNPAFGVSTSDFTHQLAAMLPDIFICKVYSNNKNRLCVDLDNKSTFVIDITKL